MKKDSEISRMFQYAGKHHILTILGMILAGISTVFSMIPFVCIWFVVRDMLHALTAGDIRLASMSGTYAWMAVGFSVLSIEAVINGQPLPEPTHAKEPKDASVAFEHVSFSYPGSETEALHDVSFTIPRHPHPPVGTVLRGFR